MLCGSTSEKVTRNRLNKLSTYGLLAHLRQTEVVELIDALMSARYVEQVDIDKFRPVLQLTQRGQEVMAGRVEQVDKLSLAAALFEKLGRGLPGAKPRPAETTRQDAAATTAGQPERQMPAQAPMPKPAPTPAAAWESIEEASDEEPSFDEIAAAQSSRPVATQPSTAPSGSGTDAALTGGAAGQPSHYWTWRLLSAAFTADECAAIRGISREVVLDHALRAIDSGWKVQAEWLLGAALIAKLTALVGEQQPERIRPLLAKLPNGTRYEEVQLYLKCRFPSGE
jgi:ATP-dependent DNA helicase RecQ